MSGHAVTPDFPAPARARRALLVLTLLAFVVSMDQTMTAVLIEPMKLELALSDVEVGLLQGTVFGIAFAASALPLGRLIDSLTRVRLLLASVMIWAVSMVLTGLGHSMLALSAPRAALGMVTALLVPAAVSLLSDLFPPERRSLATSLFVVGQSCGQAFGILLGGSAYDALIGFAGHTGSIAGLTPWRMLYVAAGLSSLLLLPLLLVMHEPQRQEKESDVRSLPVAMQELWAFRFFLIPLVAALAFSVIAFQSVPIWTASLLVRKFNLMPGQFSGWLSAATLGSGILGALAGGRLAELGRRHGGRRGVLWPALVGSLVGAPLMLFALSTSLPWFAVLLTLSLFCSSVVPTAGTVAITLNVPNEIRGTAIACYALIAALIGLCLGPTLIAMVSRLLGGERMLGVALAVVCCPSLLLSALLFGLAMRGVKASFDSSTSGLVARSGC